MIQLCAGIVIYTFICLKVAISCTGIIQDMFSTPLMCENNYTSQLTQHPRQKKLPRKKTSAEWYMFMYEAHMCLAF